MAITNPNSIVKVQQLSRFLTKVKDWVKSVLRPHETAEFGGVNDEDVTINQTSSAGSDITKIYYSTTKKTFYYEDNQTHNNWVGAKDYGTQGLNGVTPYTGKVYTHAGKAYVWNGTDLVDVATISADQVRAAVPTISTADLNTGTSTSGVLASAKAIADYVVAKINSLISGKANKATTLSGYGITDAYTKAEVNAKVSAVYKPAGSCAFNGLPATLGDPVLGNVYNVNEAFNTTANFVEGAGKAYPANTNVVVVKIGNDYKLDCLSGLTDLSGLASKTHSHAIADITNLQTTLDGKAASNHNQASSTINAMTGYAKASAASAISASDSLNTAIGKLEKALDSKQATITYATDADIDSLFA